MKNINAPNNATFVVNKLLENNFEAGFVGGCVRDYLLDKEPHDWNICTSATPTQIQDIFKDYTLLNIGLKHGTITIIVDNEPIEAIIFNGTNRITRWTNICKWENIYANFWCK